MFYHIKKLLLPICFVFPLAFAAYPQESVDLKNHETIGKIARYPAGGVLILLRDSLAHTASVLKVSPAGKPEWRKEIALQNYRYARSKVQTQLTSAKVFDKPQDSLVWFVDEFGGFEKNYFDNSLQAINLAAFGDKAYIFEFYQKERLPGALHNPLNRYSVIDFVKHKKAPLSDILLSGAPEKSSLTVHSVAADGNIQQKIFYEKELFEGNVSFFADSAGLCLLQHSPENGYRLARLDMAGGVRYEAIALPVFPKNTHSVYPYWVFAGKSESALLFFRKKSEAVYEFARYQDGKNDVFEVALSFPQGYKARKSPGFTNNNAYPQLTKDTLVSVDFSTAENGPMRQIKRKVTDSRDVFAHNDGAYGGVFFNEADGNLCFFGETERIGRGKGVCAGLYIHKYSQRGEKLSEYHYVPKNENEKKEFDACMSNADKALAAQYENREDISVFEKKVLFGVDPITGQAEMGVGSVSSVVPNRSLVLALDKNGKAGISFQKRSSYGAVIWQTHFKALPVVERIGFESAGFPFRRDTQVYRLAGLDSAASDPVSKKIAALRSTMEVPWRHLNAVVVDEPLFRKRSDMVNASADRRILLRHYVSPGAGQELIIEEEGVYGGRVNFYTADTPLPEIKTGIRFIQDDMAAALVQARKESKPVFVDAYTDWCGPCKEMEKNVFTADSVAGLFNASFVNLRLNMDKKENKPFAEKYGIKAYPFLFFVSPSDSGLFLSNEGYMKTGGFHAFGAKALKPETHYPTMKARFEAGETGFEFLKNYAALLKQMGYNPAPATDKYFSILPPDSAFKEPHWGFFKNSVWDTGFDIVEHTEKMLAKTAGNLPLPRKELSDFLFMIRRREIGGLAFSSKPDTAKYRAIREKLIVLEGEEYRNLVFQSDMAFYPSAGDWEAYYRSARFFLPLQKETENGLIAETALEICANLPPGEGLEYGKILAERSLKSPEAEDRARAALALAYRCFKSGKQAAAKKYLAEAKKTGDKVLAERAAELEKELAGLKNK